MVRLGKIIYIAPVIFGLRIVRLGKAILRKLLVSFCHLVNVAWHWMTAKQVVSNQVSVKTAFLFLSDWRLYQDNMLDVYLMSVYCVTFSYSCHSKICTVWDGVNVFLNILFVGMH